MQNPAYAADKLNYEIPNTNDAYYVKYSSSADATHYGQFYSIHDNGANETQSDYATGGSDYDQPTFQNATGAPPKPFVGGLYTKFSQYAVPRAYAQSGSGDYDAATNNAYQQPAVASSSTEDDHFGFDPYAFYAVPLASTEAPEEGGASSGVYQSIYTAPAAPVYDMAQSSSDNVYAVPSAAGSSTLLYTVGSQAGLPQQQQQQQQQYYQVPMGYIDVTTEDE